MVGTEPLERVRKQGEAQSVKGSRLRKEVEMEKVNTYLNNSENQTDLGTYLAMVWVCKLLY